MTRIVEHCCKCNMEIIMDSNGKFNVSNFVLTNGKFYCENCAPESSKENIKLVRQIIEMEKAKKSLLH